MTLREMSVEDLEQVVEIEKALFSDPWTKEGFFTFLTKENTMFFVVEEKEKKRLTRNPCFKRLVLDIAIGYPIKEKRKKMRKPQEKVVSYNRY